jgi:cytochrome c oxidase assembly protein subunit 11
MNNFFLFRNRFFKCFRSLKHIVKQSPPKNSKFCYSSRQLAQQSLSKRNKTVAIYLVATLFGFIGLAYAAAPLYRLFCQVTGFGGTVKTGVNKRQVKIVPKKEFTIQFSADVNHTLPWSFKPLQQEVNVLPGEKVLAFYEATNHGDEPLIGIATYNVVPMKVGQYFHKEQCFCFDEQRLGAHETVVLPVHFYLEPELLDDPRMDDIETIVLSYTFFLSSDQSTNIDEGEETTSAKTKTLMR